MKFWQVKNLTESTGELILSGEITNEDFWWDETKYITPQGFLDDVEPLKNKEQITLRINSYGGSVTAALAIYSYIKNLNANKICIIDGVAASAATIITCACDTVKIPINAMYMIHSPKANIYDSVGTEEVEKIKNCLEAAEKSLIATYTAKTGMEEQKIKEMMDNETWLVGREAVEMGFCDEVIDSEINVEMTNNGFVIINSVAMDVSQYKNFKTKQSQQINRPVAVFNLKNKKEERKKIMNLEELKAQYPDLVNQIIDEAEAAGTEKERERIKNIDAVASGVVPELVNKTKYESYDNAKDMLFEAFKNGKMVSAAYLNNLRQDAQESGVVNVGSNPNANEVANKKENSIKKITALAERLGKSGRYGDR